MNDTNQEDIIDTSTSEVKEVNTTEIVQQEQTEINTDEPIKAELEKVKRKGEGKTELEKLLFTEKKLQERKKQLEEEAGITHSEEEDDNAPITKGEYKKLLSQQATKTALQLADSIKSDAAKELTLYHLQNSIVPSGNPQEDFDKAYALTTSVVNKQIMEHNNLKPEIKTHSSATSTPSNQVQNQNNIQLTRDEMMVVEAGILTRDEVLKSRKAPMEFKDFKERVVVKE